jgi:hypothetical protein
VVQIDQLRGEGASESLNDAKCPQGHSTHHSGIQFYYELLVDGVENGGVDKATREDETGSKEEKIGGGGGGGGKHQYEEVTHGSESCKKK